MLIYDIYFKFKTWNAWVSFFRLRDQQQNCINEALRLNFNKEEQFNRKSEERSERETRRIKNYAIRCRGDLLHKREKKSSPVWSWGDLKTRFTPSGNAQRSTIQSTFTDWSAQRTTSRDDDFFPLSLLLFRLVGRVTRAICNCFLRSSLIMSCIFSTQMQSSNSFRIFKNRPKRARRDVREWISRQTLNKFNVLLLRKCLPASHEVAAVEATNYGRYVSASIRRQS